MTVIDETTTRRGFLKGLAAVVTLLTVAPPLIMEEVAAAPEPLETLYPVCQAGEFWMRVDGKWRLVGGLRSLATHQDVVEVASFDAPYIFRTPSLLPELTVDIASDPNAADLVRDVAHAGGKVDMLAVFGDRSFDIQGAIIGHYEISHVRMPRVRSEEDIHWRRRLKRHPQDVDFVGISLRAYFRQAVQRL